MLFLLVVCKSFSQIVTQNKDSVVILSKTVARKVAEDLIKGDSYKLISIEQDKRIKDFQLQIGQYKNVSKVNDSIIHYQSDLIKVQDKIIKERDKLHIHGYIAIQTIQLTVVNPVAYAQVMLEYKRWNLGPIYYVQKTYLPAWGIIFQYQVF